MGTLTAHVARRLVLALSQVDDMPEQAVRRHLDVADLTRFLDATTPCSGQQAAKGASHEDRSLARARGTEMAFSGAIASALARRAKSRP
jgi:hypothetical protein